MRNALLDIIFHATLHRLVTSRKASGSASAARHLIPVRPEYTFAFISNRAHECRDIPAQHQIRLQRTVRSLQEHWQDAQLAQALHTYLDAAAQFSGEEKNCGDTQRAITDALAAECYNATIIVLFFLAEGENAWPARVRTSNTDGVLLNLN